MEQPILDSVSQPEFEQAIARYISWASEWDGALPADVFFGVWADWQRQRPQIKVRARVVEGRLELISASSSSIRVQDNRIYLEDGRELVIRLGNAQ